MHKIDTEIALSDSPNPPAAASAPSTVKLPIKVLQNLKNSSSSSKGDFSAGPASPQLASGGTANSGRA